MLKPIFRGLSNLFVGSLLPLPLYSSAPILREDIDILRSGIVIDVLVPIGKQH